MKKDLTKLIKDYQPKTQTPHKWHPIPQEKPGNLPHEHKAVNKKNQEEIKDLQRKNKRLEDLEKSKKKLENDLQQLKKDLARENERVKEYQQKFEEESKAKDDLLQQKSENEAHMKEEDSSLQEKQKEQLKQLKKEVHRLRLTPIDEQGRKWFLQLLLHCRPRFRNLDFAVDF